MLDTIIKYILGEFRMIADAPVSFVVAALAAFVIIWWLMDWRYGGVISNRDSEIALYKSQRDDYRDKLSGATPEQAKQKIETLESRVTQLEPRRLKPDQAAAIRASLSSLSNIKLKVLSEAMCPDCYAYAQDFSALFRKMSGWELEEASYMGPSDRPNHGIALRVEEPTNPSPEALLFVRSLRAAGIPIEILPRSMAGATFTLDISLRR